MASGILGKSVMAPFMDALGVDAPKGFGPAGNFGDNGACVWMRESCAELVVVVRRFAKRWRRSWPLAVVSAAPGRMAFPWRF